MIAVDSNFPISAHRVETHRRVLHPPSTISQALEFIDKITSSPSCQVALPGAEFLVLLNECVARSDAKGNLVFNAQISAVCTEHGIETILTNDRDFERFAGLRVRYMDELATA